MMGETKDRKPVRFPPGSLNIYRHDDGERFWVAAPSADAAAAHMREEYDADYENEAELTIVPDGEFITITDEVTGEDTKTAREWPDESQLVCCIAGTVW